jgi:hypothetical protein
MDITIYFSRVAFIFIIFCVVSGGYIGELLSCQMRYVLKNSLYFRHIVGILLIFVFIMLEGGWSFTTDVDELYPTDWSNGNTLDTFLLSIVIYIIFIISSKSRFIPNIIFFFTLFLLYVINTQREFWKIRNIINENQNTILLKFEYIISFISLLFLIIGFTDYIIYQKKEYGKKFNWITFFLGRSICKKL